MARRRRRPKLGPLLDVLAGPPALPDIDDDQLDVEPYIAGNEHLDQLAAEADLLLERLWLSTGGAGDLGPVSVFPDRGPGEATAWALAEIPDEWRHLWEPQARAAKARVVKAAAPATPTSGVLHPPLHAQ